MKITILEIAIFAIFVLMTRIGISIACSVRKIKNSDNIEYIIHYTTEENLEEICSSKVLKPSKNAKNKNFWYKPSIFFLIEGHSGFSKFFNVRKEKTSYIKIKVNDNLRGRLFLRRFDKTILHQGFIDLTTVDYVVKK